MVWLFGLVIVCYGTSRDRLLDHVTFFMVIFYGYMLRDMDFTCMSTFSLRPFLFGLHSFELIIGRSTQTPSKINFLFHELIPYLMRPLIPQESAEPSVQSLVDRPRRTGGRPKAGPPAYAKPSARMCPIEESRLSTPFQPACGRACREVGWSGRWETKTQAGPQRTGQAKGTKQRCIPQAG